MREIVAKYRTYELAPDQQGVEETTISSNDGIRGRRNDDSAARQRKNVSALRAGDQP
jgi:hypothetical protein